MRSLKAPRLAEVAALALVAAACDACKSGGGGHPSPPPGATLATLTVTSRSFAHNGPIPVDCTCDGANRSPQLTWSAPPQGTHAYAILVEDPDAPGGDFTHWLAYNIRSDALALPEMVDPATLGGLSGTNSFGQQGYGGPCPPKWEVHHYNFHVYALDAPIDAKSGAARDAVEAALNGHVLAEGILVGTFSH